MSSVSDMASAKPCRQKPDTDCDTCGAGKEGTHPKEGWMERHCGFALADLGNWHRFVTLLHRPTDPSSLGVIRFFYGLLMLLDLMVERGLATAEYRYGDADECRFPLLDFLHPLPIQWMYMVFLAATLGALGIMLGAFFRASCLIYLLSYGYIYILDKSLWNNHSYLYGLCAFIFLFSDANRYWSVDGWLWPSLRNSHIPLWNYTLFRSQFILVYFIAGLKKLDPDWVTGFSMQKLSHHWIFSPFLLALSEQNVDLWVVHRGGLFIDLFVGYMLFFDKSRILGMLLACSFHCMNATMFTIGMFPYVMLATTPIFCHAYWPKYLFGPVFQWPCFSPPQCSSSCIYPKEMIKPDERVTSSSKVICGPTAPNTSVRWTHQMAALFTVAYITTQSVLPYSHWITPGYNNWTNGLYGYSWDMMIHSWSTQHLRVYYVDKDSGETGYLKPDAFTRGHTRWTSHADMLKQYAVCISDRLKEFNLTNVELYFDIWRSLNDRFQQRMFDPRVDLVTAPWSAFQETLWLMPLLTDLSDWRGKLDEIERTVYHDSDDTDVIFMADFPGLTVENYIQEDLGNTSITVLNGTVIVELTDREENYTLHEGASMQVPPAEYHSVHTVSETPACFMYIFVNTTEQELSRKLHKYEQDVQNGKKPESSDIERTYQQVAQKHSQMVATANSTYPQRFSKFLTSHVKKVFRSASMMRVAVQSIVTGQDFEEVFNSTIGAEDDLSGIGAVQEEKSLII